MIDTAPPRPADAADASRGAAWIGPVFIAALTLTILKGIRMPNLWGVTHYLFAYQSGFMKRGLWGEILRRLFGSWTFSYFFLAGVGLAVFAAFVAIVVVACRALPRTPAVIRFLLVFGASPALAFAAHTVGYLEQVGYLFVMIGVALRRWWTVQVAWFLAAAVMLPLVHEASILWVGGLMALALVAGKASASKRVVALVLVAVVWMVSTAAVLRFGRVSRERVDAMRADRMREIHFSLRPDAFGTLRVPLAQSMDEMRQWWSNPDRQIEYAFSLLVFAPGALALGAIAVQRARALEGRAWRTAAIALTVGGAAAPLLLHVIASDMHRWNALATLNAGLAALMLLQATPSADADRRDRRGVALALILALWGITADPVFFDSYEPARPPFMGKVLFLVRVLQHPTADMWMPKE